MPPLSQPPIYVSSSMPLLLSQSHVSFSMSPLNQPTYVSSSMPLPMSQPPYFIPPHAGPNTSITFVATLGMQEIPYNYFVQENTSAIGDQNQLAQSLGALNRAFVASTNGGSISIPNESNTTKKFLQPFGLE
ncbi:hypothetical protein ACH5RR_001806 [Cinchona calisaya]|uniref:Uncharacterized protein n=1 Tax=Cinchona calisaya TaxID=153742 RepID=A0ABD3B4G7_9GENT